MSQLDDIVMPLLSAQLFAGLGPQQVKALALEAEAVVFAPGERLISESETGDRAYLIGIGEVEESPGDADEEAPEFYGVGTLVGELAMLVETVHPVTVVARTPVKALCFKRSSIHDLMQRDPSVAEHFTSRMSARLMHVADRLREVDDLLAGSMPATETRN